MYALHCLRIRVPVDPGKETRDALYSKHVAMRESPEDEPDDHVIALYYSTSMTTTCNMHRRH
jgi:hypothetical protein